MEYQLLYHMGILLGPSVGLGSIEGITVGNPNGKSVGYHVGNIIPCTTLSNTNKSADKAPLYSHLY